MAMPGAVAAAVFGRISGQKRSDQLVSDVDFDASRSVPWFSSTAPIAILLSCFRELAAEIWVGLCFYSAMGRYRHAATAPKLVRLVSTLTLAMTIDESLAGEIPA